MDRAAKFGMGLGVAAVLGLAGVSGWWLGGQTDLAEGRSPIMNGDGAVVVDNVADQPTRPRTNTDASIDTNSLRYLGMVADNSDGDPTACLRFSSAPDPDRVIEDKAFIRVTPDVPFSLQVRGKNLCIIGLPSEGERSITVLPGFGAADGTELSVRLDEPVSFDPKPAMVGFVGDGIILPRTDGSVLGLKAMNADAVDLTLYRVNHRALFDQMPDVGETTIEGDWGWNGAAWNTRVEVHSDRIDMSGAVNALVETGYSLEPIVSEQGPGAYIVEVKRAVDGDDSRRAATSWRWLYVTDLALASYRTEDSLHVTVRSIETARTVNDVKLTLIARNNEILAEARSDAEGRARFPGAVLRGTGSLAPKMVLAYAGDDNFAALDLARSPLDLTSYDVAGRDAVRSIDAYLYTERGVYRPGETVHLTALIRDAASRAAFEREGTLAILRPDGTEFSTGRVSPDTFAGALILQIRLPADAARGRWAARLDLDGLQTVGEVRFAVEDFVPEQLRLDVRADDAPVRPGEARGLSVAADFLYGAAGRGLDAEAEARLQVDPNPFPQWADYSFGDATETFREQYISIGQGVTSEDGLFDTAIEVGGDMAKSSSPLRLFVTAGVAEPGGRYVRDSLFLPFRSEAAYVGFDPAFDGGYAKRNTPAEIALIAVDATGARTSLDGTLALIREDHDYHWYREDGRWRYRRDRRDLVLRETEVSLSASEPLQFSEALDYGEYRLRFTAESGTVFSYQFGSGWRRAGGDADTPDRIEIGLSQATIAPGDTIVLSVNAPFSGVGELVIAGRDVQSVQTVRIDEGQSDIRLPISRDAATDLYAMLSVYSPGAEERPRRAVGLVHMPLDREEQSLDVALDMPERIEPRTTQDVVVKVAGLDGEQAFLTLAAVDTGILQITDYTPPDPQDHFFGKLAFPIDLFDDYARMLAPFSGADRSGGDTLGGAGLSVVPITLVSLFEGPVSVSDGEAVIRLDIPDFQGELTVMAVAWSDTKVGSASARMVVRDPVTAQLALPRFLAPGDRAVATVALDVVDGNDGEYRVAVLQDGAEVGRADRTLERGQRSEDGIELIAGEPGISTYTLTAAGPDFDIRRDYRIQTRIPTVRETRTRFVRLDPEETLTLDLSQVRSGLTDGSLETLISASFSPGIDPKPLLASLQRYPYGCTEQTVSVALPLLLSESVGSLPRLDDTVRTASVQSALDRILGRQDVNGAFGLWRRGDGNASPYLQLYASDFVLSAQAAGFIVPDSARRRTLNAVRKLAKLDQRNDLSLDYNFGMDDDAPDYELRAAERAAHAMALLARHDRVKKTDLLYLDRRFGARLRGSIDQSQLGYALGAMGETERAQAAFARAAERIGDNDRSYYASEVRDAAALMALSDDLPNAALTSAMLTLQVDAPEQLNTHEKAWVLRALSERRSDGVPFRDSADWDISGALASRNVDAETVRINLTNTEAAPIWLQITATGFPEGEMQARSQGATLAKSLHDLDGRSVNAGAVARGERIIVTLDAQAQSSGAAMWVMADLLPAGFEIERILLPEDAGETGPFSWLGTLSSVDLTEARDDRFVASWRTQSRYGDGNRKLAYMLRATTQGDFALPGAHLEDMYRPTRSATTQGGRIRVTPAPTL